MTDGTRPPVADRDVGIVQAADRREQARRSVHTFLSQETTKGLLLVYLKGWQHEFPTWTWRYARDNLQPGDWVLDVVSPAGMVSSFFLHPDADALRLTSPAALPLPERDAVGIRSPQVEVWPAVAGTPTRAQAEAESRLQSGNHR